MIDFAISVTGRTDSFEGLHVLLVTEDDARAQAIARSLRERKAHVGDVRAGAKDPVALRGADLLVIDSRRSAAIDARVAEVRSDVRARWASVATIDYATLASQDGTVDLRALEGIVSRLAGMDKALTERARKEQSFETMLAPLGPTRTLRALALAGPTLHVELGDGALTARVELADELLVSAIAEHNGERSEAWVALARVLGMTDANVIVERRDHPRLMNIMEPVDQALESAAQERVRAPELYTEEHVEELAALHHEAPRAAIPVAAASAPRASVPQAVSRQRTLLGVAPTAPTPPTSASAPAASAPPLAVPPPPPPAAAARSDGGARSSVPKPELTRPGGKPSQPDAFADVPTDPAAPDMLRRMAAQMPANDAATTEAKSGVALSPGVQPAYHDDDDDEGEVTVVADASQLDLLRETLGRIDEQTGDRPLTSTIPAPPSAQSGELSLTQLAQQAREEMETEGDKPKREHEHEHEHEPSIVVEPQQQLEGVVPPAAPSPAPPAVDTRRDPTLRTQVTTGRTRVAQPSGQKMKGGLAIALLVLALLAIAGLYFARAHRAPPPAENAPASPR